MPGFGRSERPNILDLVRKNARSSGEATTGDCSKDTVSPPAAATAVGGDFWAASEVSAGTAAAGASAATSAAGVLSEDRNLQA